LAADDNSADLPSFTPEAMKANRGIVDVLNEFGHPRGLTSLQVTLVWLLAKKTWIVPIPGTTKLTHLKEYLEAANFQFTSDELLSLEGAISNIKIQGDRYSR
jgi:aryl-alcohol dehydrogenase-like predicted oxidoreductase